MGELVTGIAVIAGAIFVGDVVLDIIGSLVELVKLATGATDEAGLRAAAKELTRALTLGRRTPQGRQQTVCKQQ